MTGEITELSTGQLANHLQNERFKLIDIRPVEAYNGWRLMQEPRGGHIPGARSIPLKWTRYMDWVEVLEEKNISEDYPVIVYGYSSQETEQMAGRLLDLGFGEVFVYNRFVSDWAADRSRPLERLERYEKLVYPGWIRQLIGGGKPESYDGRDYVICHSNYDYPEDYRAGHIPGAVSLDTNSLESTDSWNCRTPEELTGALTNLGIRHDTLVVVYGRFSSPDFNEDKFPGKNAGHLGAIRCAAILMYAGVEDVRILNGGVASWEIDGYTLSTDEVLPEPVEDFGAVIPACPQFMIDTEKAKELLSSDTGELVSVRSWEEFIGNSSGYHYIGIKGRIPGAVFGNCGSDAYHMENYRNFDHTMREYHEIAEKWKGGGITPDKQIAFYCGTGWRGSEAFMNAWLMGWPRISVYDGGWYEWCNDPENPIETGLPREPARVS